MGVAALLFAASVAATIAWCGPMAGMDMPMPGGWTMSMAWMRMPGQSWWGAASSFLGMWDVMMLAMMLPSLVPTLRRARAAAGRARARGLRRAVVLAGLGYFVVWTLAGAAVFPLGAGLAALEMRSAALARGVPAAIGAIVVAAGLLQLTRWKARQLACCRATAGGHALPPQGGAAFRWGLRLGRHCVSCCFGLTVVLLVVGVMNLPAMALVGVAMTVERLAPAGPRAARAIGVGTIAVGLALLRRASGLG